jgi:hypothetical protein
MQRIQAAESGQAKNALLPGVLPLLQNAVLSTLIGQYFSGQALPTAAPASVQRYLDNAFGDHLAEVRIAMEALAARYDPG